MPPQTDSSLDSILRRLRPVAYCVGVLSFFINFLILPMSIYSLQVMDRIMSTGSIPTLIWLTFIMLVMFAVAGVLQTLRGMVLIRAADWLHECITEVALPKMLAQAATGGSGAQHMRDALSLKQFIVGNAFISLVDAPWAIIYIIGLFVVHSTLGFLVTGGAALLVLLAWVNEISMRSAMKEAGGTQMQGLQELELATRNAEVTEAMGMSRSLTARWKTMQKDATSLQSLAGSRSAVVQGLTKFVRLALQILVTCIAAYLAVHGDVTVGAIIAASILASRALAPFEVAISSWKFFGDARSAYARLKVVFQESCQESAMILPPPLGNLTLEQVGYAIAGLERPLLRNISFTLERGDMLGIIGSSGSGKSTLARLILSVYPLSSGAVRLDGADVYRWPKHELGKYVGYVPQDVELFGGSIKDNIARFSNDASPDDIVRAAQIASAHELILRLPKGYDTDIGASGAKLSAGQRQRIALARAFYGDPRLLILDEPDANLDELGQQALLFALNEAKKRNITTLLITHRTSLLAHVDKLLLLRDGLAEAFGPAAQVIAALNARQQTQRAQETAAP